MKRQMKNEVGITLVALVITIIILLILAGISIQAINNTGLFANAKKAKEKSMEGQLKEEITLAIQSIQTEEIYKGNRLTSYESKIDEITGGRDTANSKIFIDTSKKIGCVGQSSDWCNTSYSYTATEDCAILGRIGTNSGCSITILINSVDIGYMRTINSFSYSSINYYLKKGDTIEIKNNIDGNNGTSYVQVYAYGLK